MSDKHTQTGDTVLEPAVIVIFGITGDLSQRYLLPSLYHLIKDGLLPEQTEILGITRGTTTVDQLFEEVNLCPNSPNKVCDPEAVTTMRNKTRMLQMNLDSLDDYRTLRRQIDDLETTKGMCLNRLFYLSIPPLAYLSVIDLMGQAELNGSCQHNHAQSRLLVEKPFGYNLDSAQKLIEATAQVFKEDQIFRIDHYLAKEMVQNMLTFRFDNPIFESLWSNKFINKIDIIAYEKIGIEGRASFYEPLGALRDFVQSHLVQLLAIATMDQTEQLDSVSIHASKQAVLDKVKPVPAEEVNRYTIRGQYKGYREEVNNAESITETYASITVFIDSERWQGVPITMSTGKALAERLTEICITFHNQDEPTNNQLRFRLQPDEGITLDLVTKKPGFDHETQVTSMKFLYQNDFDNHGHPDAYERVLVDAVRGDHTLFATSGEVLASWRILQPVTEAWSHNADGMIFYEPGSQEIRADQADQQET